MIALASAPAARCSGPRSDLARVLRSLCPRPRRSWCVAPAPLAVAAFLCLLDCAAVAQPLPPYRRTPPAPPPAPPAETAPPTVTLTADDVLSHIGGVAQARGHVELQRLDVDLFSDYLQYDQLSDTAHAEGDVRVNRGLDWFTAD